MNGEVPANPEKPIDPVVEATDRRIRKRGLAEFGKVIQRMANDPSWAPDPIDLIGAGILEEGDIIVPEDLRDLDDTDS